MAVTSEHGHWHRYYSVSFQGTDNHWVWSSFQYLVDGEWRTDLSHPRRDTDPWNPALGQTQRSWDDLGAWSDGTGMRALHPYVPCEAHAAYCLRQMSAKPHPQDHDPL